MKNPLLRMLWWERVAPLGKPVVPDVYWMLIGSSKVSSAARSATCSADTARPLASSSSHDVAQGRRRRAHLLDHRAVVARLELRRRDQRADRRLIEDVLELVRAVGGVD